MENLKSLYCEKKATKRNQKQFRRSGLHHESALFIQMYVAMTVEILKNKISKKKNYLSNKVYEQEK